MNEPLADLARVDDANRESLDPPRRDG